MLRVPSNIERPEYMFHDGPEVVTTSDVKSPEVVEKIRAAGKIASDALALAGSLVEPGRTTDEIDREVHQFIISQGAYPSTLGYMGYPKSICTSINEVICHGIPDDRPLEEGDIVNVDVTVYKNGAPCSSPAKPMKNRACSSNALRPRCSAGSRRSSPAGHST